MQSTITALAELLGRPLSTQCLRSQMLLSSLQLPRAPSLEGVPPLAWPQHKGKDRVPCLGAQTWVGAWGEGPQLPGPHPRASLASGAGASSQPCPLPEVQPGPCARPPALCGCPGHQRRRLPLCASLLGAGCWVLGGWGCSRAPLDC